MKSRLFFRENGCVIQTRSTSRDGLWVVVAVVVLLLLLGWGHRVDQAGQVDQAAEDRGQFDAGMAAGLAQAQDTVMAAYFQGVAEGMAGVQDPAVVCQPGAAPAAGSPLLTGGRP